LTHVHFPLAAIVSLLYVMENGASAEIAVVGNDGMVGFALIMGGDTTPSRAVVQSAGVGLRMKAQFMRQKVAACGTHQVRARVHHDIGSRRPRTTDV